jgi:hypothetical protein
MVNGPINGVFAVTAKPMMQHTYLTTSPSGTFPVTVTITDPSGQTGMAQSTAVVVAAPVIIATGTTFPVTPGIPVSTNVVVASFTDTNPIATTTLPTAVIAWGDGTTSAGAVIAPPTNSGSDVFTVMPLAPHTYLTASASGSFAVTVTITDPSGQTGTAQSTALVTAPLIVATGTTFTVTPGSAFSGTVATFTDTNPTAKTTLPTAVITWGDGTTSAGTVTGPPPNSGSDVFTVVGSHTYLTTSASGSFAVSVTITDPSGQTGTAQSTAVVPGAPTITATGTTFSEPLGIPFSDVTVATFTDTNPMATAMAGASNLTAVIAWGDGTTSAGMVKPPPDSSGVFSVTGSHTYTITSPSGSFAVTVTITDPTGQTGTAHSTAVVTAPVIIATGTTFSVTPGPPGFSGTVASFTDSNPKKTMTPTAVIAWGDGTTSAGTVTGPDNNGVFTVTASAVPHIYLTSSPSGSFPVVVTITDVSGQTATANSTALTVNSGPAFNFSGELAPVVNGPNSGAGHSNTNRPIFSGTAPPFSTIQVFAHLYGVDATELLGQTVAGPTGSWSLLTGPLARGEYTVTAIYTPPGASPSPQTLLQKGQPVFIQFVQRKPHTHRHAKPKHEKHG